MASLQEYVLHILESGAATAAYFLHEFTAGALSLLEAKRSDVQERIKEANEASVVASRVLSPIKERPKYMRCSKRDRDEAKAILKDASRNPGANFGKTRELEIDGRSMSTLASKKWLNDEVINAYLKMVELRSRSSVASAQVMADGETVQVNKGTAQTDGGTTSSGETVQTSGGTVQTSGGTAQMNAGAQSSFSFTPSWRRELRVVCMSTFFWTKLAGQSGTTSPKYDYGSVKKWLKRKGVKNLLTEVDLLIVPVNMNNTHWALGVVDLRSMTTRYLDSLGGFSATFRQVMERYVNDESTNTEPRGTELRDRELIDREFADSSNQARNAVSDDGDGVSLKICDSPLQANEVPQQENGYDCGVFACLYAECLADGREPDFSQNQIPDLRCLMVAQLARGSIG